MDAGRRFDVPHIAAQGIKRSRLHQLLQALLCLPLLGLKLLASKADDEFRAQTLPVSFFAMPLNMARPGTLPSSLRHVISVTLTCGLSAEPFAECLYGLAGWPRLPSLKPVDRTDIGSVKWPPPWGLDPIPCTSCAKGDGRSLVSSMFVGFVASTMTPKRLDMKCYILKVDY